MTDRLISTITTLTEARLVERQLDLPELLPDIWSNTYAERRGISSVVAERTARKVRASVLTESFRTLRGAREDQRIALAEYVYVLRHINNTANERTDVLFWCLAQMSALDWGGGYQAAFDFLFHEGCRCLRDEQHDR